jgi:hypothetical protein
VTLVRVRQVRASGVDGSVRCRDWVEAIRRLGHNFGERLDALDYNIMRVR